MEIKEGTDYECGYGHPVEHDIEFYHESEHIVDLSAICYKDEGTIHIIKDLSFHMMEWEEDEHRDEYAEGISLKISEAKQLVKVLNAMIEELEKEE